jgi:hypothetical protein
MGAGLRAWRGFSAVRPEPQSAAIPSQRASPLKGFVLVIAPLAFTSTVNNPFVTGTLPSVSVMPT